MQKKKKKKLRPLFSPIRKICLQQQKFQEMGSEWWERWHNTEGSEAAKRLPLAQDNMAWKGLQEIIRSNHQCSGSYVVGMHYVRWLCPSAVRALLFHTPFSL